MSKKQKRRIAVFDLETDPFLFGRKPEPFAAGFYDGVDYVEFWGSDCVVNLANYCEDRDGDFYLMAHNGGKFDFIYLIERRLLENPVKVINGRIVSAKMGRHTLRDSYAFLPVPLAAYQKDEIDYSHFEKGVRDRYKAEILHYLKKDCEYLFDMVKAFTDRFGVQLTIGGTAIKQLEKFHPFERQNRTHDETFRPFYFGGRVQCFETGHIRRDLKVYDVNSMYPYVMSTMLHPTGREYSYFDGDNVVFNSDYDVIGFEGKPYFIHFEGDNHNALPTRTKSGLDFTISKGEFYTTSHEFKVCMRYGLVKPSAVLSVFVATKTIAFAEYVNHFIIEKVNAKKAGDRIAEIFAKLLLNSAYGKFGQNPDHYKDWIFKTEDLSYTELLNAGYTPYQDYDGVELWERPSDNESYFDVATAASITGASRAVLLEALQHAKGVVYCDTDSIICESYDGDIDSYRLGAWDFEKEGDAIFIYAKKIYALYHKGVCVKLASKGVRMNGEDIIKLCKGINYVYKRDAPNLKMTGEAKFIERELRGLENGTI